MKTYLFTWNPSKWQWKNLPDKVREVKEVGYTLNRWSCGKSKNMRVGDRAFLMKLGQDGTTQNHKGIVGSGEIESEYFIDKHWSGEKFRYTNYVNIKFDVLLNPAHDAILDLEALRLIKPQQLQQWVPQQSGINIKPDVAFELQRLWFNFLKEEYPAFLQIYSDEKPTLGYEEGAGKLFNSTRYERNPFAREECIKYFGAICSVCRLDFGQMYGEIGRGYIHVHHLTPLATHQQRHVINPLNDLIPVCPNCHAMLHRRNPPFTIEELQALINLAAVGEGYSNL